MLKAKHYTAILPFWPLQLADSQNYFLYPLLTAEKLGLKTRKLISPSHNQILNLLHSGHLLHFQTTYRSILISLCLSLLKQRSAKIIWTPHLAFKHNHQPTLPLNLIKLLKPLLQKINLIIAITPHEYQYFQSLGYTNLAYLPLVIDTLRLPYDQPQPNRLNLLFFGGDRPVKNLLPVLQAVNTLNRLQLSAQLHLLDPVSQRFIRLHHDQISPHIHLYGRLPHLSKKFNQLLSQSTIYINNSLAEGSPLAAYEAAFAGLNCCLADLPTLKSIFKTNALYHHPNHPDQLTSNLLYYYLNPPIAQTHRQANRRQMNKLSLKHWQTKFTNLLNQLL